MSKIDDDLAAADRALKVGFILFAVTLLAALGAGTVGMGWLVYSWLFR